MGDLSRIKAYCQDVLSLQADDGQRPRSVHPGFKKGEVRRPRAGGTHGYANPFFWHISVSLWCIIVFFFRSAKKIFGVKATFGFLGGFIPKQRYPCSDECNLYQQPNREEVFTFRML